MTTGETENIIVNAINNYRIANKIYPIKTI